MENVVENENLQEFYPNSLLKKNDNVRVLKKICLSDLISNYNISRSRSSYSLIEKSNHKIFKVIIIDNISIVTIYPFILQNVKEKFIFNNN